jgi:hypothetical protein
MTPWPESADGVGYSLVPTEINPTGDLNDAANWRLSLYAHGSPGCDDAEECYEHIIISETPAIPISGNNLHFNVYPNPVTTTATINLTLQKSEQIKISLFNVLGYQVSTLHYNQMPAGQQFIEINFDEFKAGLYLLMIETKDYREVKKLIIQK